MNNLLGIVGTVAEFILALICYYVVIKKDLCYSYGKVVIMSLGMFLTFVGIVRTLTACGYFTVNHAFIANGLASIIPVGFLVFVYISNEFLNKRSKRDN